MHGTHSTVSVQSGCSDDGYPLVSLWLPGGREVVGEVRREVVGEARREVVEEVRRERPNILSQCTSSDSELGLD